ncbi:MAG: hypothetical protein K5984_06630, partial [Bacteroidales bacterium]|nr:hypothetical protein [Bacteroidales bacterium]
SSMATWIASRNNSSILYLTKQISGVSETLSYTGIYGIDTFGWTSEASARWNGFGLHVLLTLQNPEYSDFRQEFTFSNGSSETIDYSGNFVTGMSRVLLELDPSFHFKKWNISASARYFSKQYANRLNNTWFDGHWETFASIGCQVRDDLGVKLDVVNFLNQTGISGSLDAADAITDTSLLKNMYIAGTYIRPLTFNIAVTYKF